MVSCFLYFVVLQQPQVLLLQQECVLVSAEEFGEEARRDRVATCFFSSANPGEKKKDLGLILRALHHGKSKQAL
jgi:hypothetical protein